METAIYKIDFKETYVKSAEFILSFQIFIMKKLEEILKVLSSITREICFFACYYYFNNKLMFMTIFHLYLVKLFALTIQWESKNSVDRLFAKK